MSRLVWFETRTADGRSARSALSDGLGSARFTIARHGEGRKYWGVTYPDGTYTHNALTQAEAKAQAESWQPDPEPVTLSVFDHAALEQKSVAPDSASTAGQDALPSAIATSQEPLTLTAAAAVSAVIDGAPAVKIRSGGYAYSSTGQAQDRALSVLVALAELRAEVEVAIKHQVSLARTNSGTNWYSNAATWEQVGKALGVTKQSAQARYGPKAS